MSLDDATRVAERLRDGLAEEVTRAQSERELLSTLDAQGLFERAAKRDLFNITSRTLQQELAAELSRFAEAYGLGEVTISSLSSVDPRGATVLTALFDEIRALASALAELDELNLMLAGRTLQCVRGYLTALRPRPTAYDRSGRPGGRGTGSGTVSRRV